MSFGLWAAIVLLSSTALLSGDDARPTISVNVDVVNVLCTVRNKQGSLVPNLEKNDFEILEAGRRQEIRYFARDSGTHLSVALLVDVSGSVEHFIDEELQAADRFLEAVLRPTDSAMLLGFSSALFQWQKLTASSELLHRAILKVRSQPVSGLVTADPSAPGTMLYDAIHSTAIHQLASVPGRKAIVVISDGIDRGSRTKPESAIRAVQATDTIVYAICYGSGLRWVPEKSSLFPGCDLLQQLVEPTGGRLFKARKKMTFSKIFDVIQEELHSQYSLGYVPTNSKRDGSFRRLQIRLKRRGIKAQARQGYYANPAPRKASDIADAP